MEKMNIPKYLSTRLRDALQDIVDSPNMPEHYGTDLQTEVTEVEHKSYDGFIAFTNGGFDLTLPTDLQLAFGSGSRPANKKIEKQIDDIIEQNLEYALYEFVQENESAMAELFPNEDLKSPNADVINYNTLYDIDQGQLAEQLSEYENSYLSEGAEYFYQFRVLYYSADNIRNESGNDELVFIAGVNLDFTYGRDKGLEVTYENCVPVKLLTTDMIGVIINEMIESI